MAETKYAPHLEAAAMAAAVRLVVEQERASPNLPWNQWTRAKAVVDQTSKILAVWMKSFPEDYPMPPNLTSPKD